MAEQQIEIVATEISEIEDIEAAPMSEIEAVEISEIEAIEAIEMSEIEGVEISEIEIAETSDPEPSNNSRQSIEHFEVLSSRQIPGPGNNILRHGNSLIPEVRSIVSSNDDPNLESMTIRTWIIGPIVCATMATVRARVLFDHKSLDIPVDFILFSILLVGNLMAAKLANRIVRVPLIGFEFSLNPGGFNSKENFLTCAFAYIGMARPNMLQTIAVLRNHFGEQVYPSAAYFAVLSSYLLSNLLVGLFLNWVLSPAMWWPSKLLDVVFFRTWHREYDGSMGSITNRKFFIIFFVVSIIYHIPTFLYPPIATLSFLCWRWKKSTTAQQIGSGVNGLGLFSFSIDWSSLSDFMGDPLSTPRPVIYNVMGGFFITFFVLIPSIYWTNAYQTKRFPLFSASMYDASGNIYNITRVLNHDGVTINEQAYKDYSPVFWSAFALISYCLKFASIPAGFIHVLVYYGRGMWEVVNEDEHNEMMRQYQPLRRFWFFVVSAIAFCLACASCAMGLGPNIRFPFLLILAAIAVALLIFTPMGIFVATTSQVLPGYLVCRLLGGYLYDNKPFQFLIFNDYANQSATNAILFLGTLKLGHYMKVNPRNTFIVLVAASMISASVGFGVSWQLGTGHAEKPGGSPLDMVYQMAITWGVIGPRRLFNDGNYAKLILSFVAIFAIAELILLIASRKWKLIKEIKLPVILATTVGMPPAVPANLNSWFFVGLVFPVVASHFKANWSPNYQYLLAVSLTTGVGVLSALGYLMTKVIPTWGSQSKDYCPLAKCPTAPGMRVEDCE